MRSHFLAGHALYMDSSQYGEVYIPVGIHRVTGHSPVGTGRYFLPHLLRNDGQVEKVGQSQVLAVDQDGHFVFRLNLYFNGSRKFQFALSGT